MIAGNKVSESYQPANFFSEFLSLQFQVDDKKTKMEEMKSLCKKYTNSGITKIECENIHIEGNHHLMCANQECSICLDDFNDYTVRLNCNHQFHLSCFDTMAQTAIMDLVCPNCRQEVKSLFIYAYDSNLPHSHDIYDVERTRLMIIDDLSDGSMLNKLILRDKKEKETEKIGTIPHMIFWHNNWNYLCSNLKYSS